MTIITSFRLPFLLILFLTLIGCSGHRFKNFQNPLAQYNINSLSVPMFLNRSSRPDLSGPFTKEVILMLSQFPGLQVYSGDWKKTDAILLGILDSNETVRKTVTNSSDQYYIQHDYYPADIGERRDFYLPRKNIITLNLTLIMVKNPTHREIEQILDENGNYTSIKSKILFEEIIPLSGTISRVLQTGYSRNYPGERKALTNYTKSRGNEVTLVGEMAQNAAQTFKETILYAF